MTSSQISSSAKGGEEFGEQVLAKAVKAGRRTYFFDVKATRGGDYFLTITESRKMTHPDGTFAFDKHKIFLYKEDFTKFTTGLLEVIDFIRSRNPEFFAQQEHGNTEQQIDEEFAAL